MIVCALSHLFTFTFVVITFCLFIHFHFPRRRGGAMEGSMESPVAEFYRDKTVFITGATGFMGKVDMKLEILFLYKLIKGVGGETTQKHLRGSHLLAHPAQGPSCFESNLETTSSNIFSSIDL